MKMNKILYKKHCLFLFTYFTLGKKIKKKKKTINKHNVVASVP